MPRILVVNGSPHVYASSGWSVVEFLLAQIHVLWPTAEAVHRLLSAPEMILPSAAYATAVQDRAADDSPAFELSEILIGELESCDLLIIATPIHNFTVPAALKAWIDYVLRINRTFDATPTGKIGRLNDRPVFVVVTSGGFHQGERASQADFLSDYLRCALQTVGLKSIQFVYLQGMAYGEGAASLAINAGIERIRSLLPALLQQQERSRTGV
ncbi:FMN-dependent NADH-azoreductase [Candidatus Methylospira mobilis]|uniref:FMN dependent NADH:quinone oxidoreductase n=1 Tax=Candidatus Methylospira mobilis TaxID=1808979 RepID=A0A5Q0BPS2_9GAMM|nr:NAD(P)H-dependent oxidoreductase [Candidatus Methylospira mobilis]QFY44291.1 FMN-dependent NADH-azoreductase [Candidatus Methylospira mobilis]WNV06283.1 NAD(P)H-dependent oxidoreductase [Candidatus Methylospira mobilis]